MGRTCIFQATCSRRMRRSIVAESDILWQWTTCSRKCRRTFGFSGHRVKLPSTNSFLPTV